MWIQVELDLGKQRTVRFLEPKCRGSSGHRHQMGSSERGRALRELGVECSRYLKLKPHFSLFFLNVHSGYRCFFFFFICSERI